jgi:hypothetical protein
MVAEPRTWVGVMECVRAWARSVLPSLSGRVFFNFNKAAPMPQIVLRRIAGPDDRSLFQFNVYAALGNEAEETEGLLCTAIDQLSRYVQNGVFLHGAVVEDVRWQPDPEANTPCYVVDATFFATAG